MAVLVGLHGYGAVSVAQVIETAGVSRKTYYEHFDDKLDCFLESYESTTNRLIDALRRPDEGPSKTARQVEKYLAAIAANPVVARAFIVEVMGAGERALLVRERVNRRFADLVFAHVSPDARVRKAFIGGVNDVVTGELLAGRKRFDALLPALLTFVEGPSRSARLRP
ncbi:MAG: helix-turn-helix domain-containing protein [Myxococcaceae bacterium]|nr:helix-turn-helix domain-containing protein [Myxococcaceae bacterium]